MNRRHFIAAVAALPLAGRTIAQSPTPEHETSPVETISHEIGLSTPIETRYQLTLNRVLYGKGPAYTPDFLLDDIHATVGRRFTNFSGDVSGRWIGALASVSALHGQDIPVLHEVVQQVLRLQHPDGYFGKTFHFDQPNDDDLALLWGNGRLLVGLVEYYELKHDSHVIKAAKSLGDFLIRIGPNFNSKKMADAFGAAHFASSYICWTQQTEGLAKLYRVTGDSCYGDLCATISERIERRPADHVHGYLCSLRGTLDLYNVTRNAKHLQRVEAAWNDIMQSGDVLVTGGVPEAWSPKRKRTEGCAECDWLRLNLSLWQATGNPVYLTTAERVLFNELAMNQFHTGDFGHASLDAAGVPRTVNVRAWWCCTLHGLRTFPEVQRSVFRTQGDHIFYDLPIDGKIETPACTLHSTSNLSADGTVKIHINHASPNTIIHLRKPSWSNRLQVTVNGRAVSGTSVSAPKIGDIVTVKYAMTLDIKPFDTREKSHKKSILFYGPWLLGASSQTSPEYFNELHSENVLLTDTAKPASPPLASSFDVPIAATSVGYIPAEFPEQPGQIELHAVAEQTAYDPAQWMMVFALKEKV